MGLSWCLCGPKIPVVVCGHYRVFGRGWSFIQHSQILHICFDSQTLLQMGQQLPFACKLFYREAYTRAAAPNPMYVCVFSIESELTVWRFEEWMRVGRENFCWSAVRLWESDSYVVNHGCVCNLAVGMTGTYFFFSFSTAKNEDEALDLTACWSGTLCLTLLMRID